MTSIVTTREIHDNYFVISSDHTCYANERKLEAIPSQEEALAIRKQILDTAKAKSAKISFKNGYKSDIIALSHPALEQHDLYNQRFEALKSYWLKVIPTNEIRDQSTPEFTQGYELRNQMMAMLHGNTELSQYIEICNQLRELKANVVSSTSLSGVTISL